MTREEADNCAAWIAKVYTHLNASQTIEIRGVISPYDRALVESAVRSLLKEREFLTINSLVGRIYSEVRRRGAEADSGINRIAREAEINRRIDEKMDAMTDTVLTDLREALIEGYPPTIADRLRRHEIRASAIVRAHMRPIIDAEIFHEEQEK